MQSLSPQKFLVACVAVAVFVGIPHARAATIVPDFPFTNVTVGDPLPVWLWFYYQGGPAPDNYLESFYGTLYYDSTLLRPQRVTFSGELGSPDRKSYAFDAASEEFVADVFGSGEATTLAADDPFFGYPFPPPPPGQDVVRVGEWSFVFNELFQPGGFPAAMLTFETLRPGTAPFFWVYEMNGRGPYTSTASAEIRPAPVPEPSTLWLILAGAPFVAARMRRARSAGRSKG